MTYEFKITTEDPREIKRLSKTDDYYCAILEIVNILRDIDKHQSDRVYRDVGAIRAKVYEILESYHITLSDY